MAPGDVDPPARIEPRWVPMLAVLVLLLLLELLSARLRVVPDWLPFLLAALLIVPMALVQGTGARAPWPAVERWAILLFFAIVGAGTFWGFSRIVGVMLGSPSQLTGVQLLSSSIAAWMNIVFIFSMLYWTLDRGGPEARANDTGVRPDWFFPQSGVPEALVPGWRPTFVDYLYLGFSTASAFSAADVLPLTPRAKLLMMLESILSLATILVVASRAINILGG